MMSLIEKFRHLSIKYVKFKEKYDKSKYVNSTFITQVKVFLICSRNNRNRKNKPTIRDSGIKVSIVNDKKNSTNMLQLVEIPTEWPNNETNSITHLFENLQILNLEETLKSLFQN